MAKVLTDKNLIEKFLTRGVDHIYPTPEALEKKLMSGERLRIYQGFDPTGPYLHVGHAIGIRALRILQQLGHEVIFLVGDFTSKVGDPDKDSTRKMLTDEEIEKNMSGWKEQAAQLIDFEGDNPVQFKRNFEWLSKLKLEDILKLASHVTVQQMLKRDLFGRRIKDENPIKLHEFLYPIMQGYDGVAMEVDMEIGGADQTFNMLVGRDLSKGFIGKEKFVRTNKMMDAPDGRTMSKTKGNGINLADDGKTMYGKAMSYPDSSIISGLELLTEVPMEEIESIKKRMESGENPMQFKKLMAFEIVKMIKGEVEAGSAEKYFVETFSERQIPGDIPEVAAKEGERLVDVIVRSGAAKSVGDARRKIDQGGVEINSERVTDANRLISLTDAGATVKVGKKTFFEIKR